MKSVTTQRMKFSIKDFFGGCGQIRRKRQSWLHLLGKSLMGGFIFCAVCRGCCAMSRVRLARASAFEVYYAGKLQWHFTYGFDFRHSLWLPFVAAFAVLKGLNINYPGNVLKLDQHKMTHNFEKSFACPKCEKEFLQKDNMLEQVKKHSLKWANFIARYPGYIYELLYCYIYLNFNFVFVKYFLLLTIDRRAFFSDRTFMSTIVFMLCFLFKLIEQLGRLFVPTLLCLCRLPILDFLLETAVGCTLISIRFCQKMWYQNFEMEKVSGFDWMIQIFYEFNQSEIEFFVFIFDFFFHCFKKIIKHFWNLFCKTVTTNTIGFTF